MKALVISGGGCKGAFAGGIAEYLINEAKKKYDLFIGSSAGSLLIPLLGIGEIERLKKVFTSITEHDVFSTNPFLVTHTNGARKIAINHAGTIRMFVSGKKTFGESGRLKRLIRKTFSQDDFERLKASGTRVVVCVSNISRNTVEYFSAHNSTYDDFCDWMWASANMVPFMSVLRKNGCEYADGGLGNRIPLREALHLGATEVDAIILNPKNTETEPVLSHNAFELTFKVYNFMLNQISNDDILLGKYEGAVRKVDINFYFTPRVLTEHTLVFDPAEMKRWWKEGFEFAQNHKEVVEHIEPPGKKF